ncbi:hypothetical protein ACWGCK_28755 [Streptomyces virginiae]
MLVMAVAGDGSGMLVWMAVLTGIVLTERLARTPRRPTRLAAAVLAVAALAVLLPDTARRWSERGRGASAPECARPGAG